MTPTQLRERRAALGLTQARLGAALGVPENTIYRWERGMMPIAHAPMLDLALKHLEAHAMTRTTRCCVCDLAIDNPGNARETPCGRHRHADCGMILSDGAQVGHDCAICIAAHEAR